MLIYIIIAIVVTQTYSLGIVHTVYSHSRIVRRRTEYRINISMSDNDIEMVKDKIELNTTSKFSKIFRKKPHTIPQSRGAGMHSQPTYSKTTNLLSNQSQVDLVNSTKPFNNSLRKGNNGDAKSKESSNKTDDTVQIETNKTESEDQSQPRIAREISADRVWNILQIWMIVYVVLAIPLWCTIGRCCCCLVCKCCKAQETIRSAKQYAMWNPPGVLRKKTGDVIYVASEKEREAYEELEHLIRTL